MYKHLYIHAYITIYKRTYRHTYLQATAIILQTYKHLYLHAYITLYTNAHRDIHTYNHIAGVHTMGTKFHLFLFLKKKENKYEFGARGTNIRTDFYFTD